jgi:hypothetical protein
VHVPFEPFVEFVGNHAPQKHGNGGFVRFDDILLRGPPHVKGRLVSPNHPSEGAIPLDNNFSLGMKIDANEQIRERGDFCPQNLRGAIFDVKLGGTQNVFLVDGFDGDRSPDEIDPAAVPYFGIEPSGFDGMDFSKKHKSREISH